MIRVIRFVYLETFAVILKFAVAYKQDAASEITAELQGIPDFIIGNYSDGNLVASLLASKMGVTQVVAFSCSLHVRVVTLASQ